MANETGSTPRDPYQELLASYAVADHTIPEESEHEVKRRLIDSFGVMCAALQGDAPQVVREYARQFPFQPGASVFGSSSPSTPEIAGFANGVHVRYLDFNDTYLSLEPLHPSDVIPPLFALAEWVGLGGKDLIAAVAIAYEVSMNLCDAASLRIHGWDHVNYIGLGAAAGAAHLLDLSQRQAAHALSISLVPHAAMRQTRAGELSMWKGAAAANSARNGLFAALLAAKGFTGPYEPFVGEMGAIQQLLGGTQFLDVALESMKDGKPPKRICDSYIKAYPVEYHAQSAVDAAAELHQEIGDWQDIESIKIETFQVGYEIIAKDEEKWAPTTRETADHSLQYIVAAVLIDGFVDRETFSDERLSDPRIRSLLHKTTVEEALRLSEQYPKGIPNAITVRTKDGREHFREVTYPRGHAQNRMEDTEVVAKFTRNRQGVLSEEQAQELVVRIWELERLDSMKPIVALWPKGD